MATTMSTSSSRRNNNTSTMRRSSVVLVATAAAVVVLLLLSTAVVVVVDAAAVTVCPKANSIQKGLRYHHDGLCDRAEYGRFKNALGRPERYGAFRAKGGVATVPSERTIKCPANGVKLDLSDPHRPATGLDTVFFFENASSGPIVISYVDEMGMEHSAKNPAITPATADPDAYVLPGGFMAVYAFEGHQFVAREVMKETGLAGNVLAQHRAGLIPVGTYSTGLTCPDVDIEPVVENTTIRAPEFRRTPPASHRPCNTMDIGFRNEAECPLHVYYVSSNNNNPGGDDKDNNDNSCTEAFKFHLGVESVVDDFHWDWTSETKYEGSFVGHTFHFRLASNPTVLVDTVTISPVVVTDCPTSSTPVGVAVHGQAVPVYVDVVEPSRDHNDDHHHHQVEEIDVHDVIGGMMMPMVNNTAHSFWDDQAITNITRVVQGYAQQTI